MKIIVFTSNSYLYLLPGFCELFNKYWPNQEPYILGYDFPKELLPQNFSFISLGKQEEFNPYWTTALIPYFRDFPYKYFLAIMDDCFLIKKVNLNKFNLFFDKMKELDADKIVFSVHTGKFNDIRIKDDMIIWEQNRIYRTTLQISMWKVDYFLKYCKPNLTPQDFELNENQGKNDGAIILSSDNDDIIYKYEILRRGKPDKSQFHLLSSLNIEDRKIIERYIK